MGIISFISMFTAGVADEVDQNTDDGLWHDAAYFPDDDGLWHDEAYFDEDDGLWHDETYF